MVDVFQMREEQWQRVRAIRLRALQDTPDAFGTTFETEARRLADQWIERLTSDDRVTFIAQLDGKDVGLIACAPYNGADVAGLFSMWTAPEARKLGVGSRLVETVVMWAASKGYRTVALDVANTNIAAIALYEKFGFRPTGHTGTLPPPRTHIKEHRRELQLAAPRP
ncbi:MAG TPA: GNAT family N-acetyltransferase [Hyphomicrobiales bacterium]|nr:GNAT family N-acetyltransferase [Hyphomicrobiales bacterium]